jgi:hypothetical protein
MPVLKDRKLEILAQGLALGKSAVEAAKDAGYNQAIASFVANAQQRASKPAVKERVAELQQRTADCIAERVSVDRSWLLAQLVEVAGYGAEGLEIKMSDKLKALELVAKVCGLFAPEKREVIARLAELDIEQLRALDQRLAEAEQDEQPDAEDLH